MDNYHVNTNAQKPNGEHEVHKTGCAYQPKAENRQDLGSHADCHAALRAAKSYYTKVDGCIHCAKACHSR